MKPELILHIGAPKCGSSTIQSFLSHNRKQLRTMGFIVPDEKLKLSISVPGNHVWILQNFSNNLDRGEKLVRSRLLELGEKLEDTGRRGIILSAENLSDGFGLERLFASLEEFFTPRIIVYIRRQDDFLLSAWQQWYVKRSDDFWMWLIRSITTHKRGDWLQAIQPWIDTFGMKAITVRRFGRQYFDNGDLLTDFCNAISLDSSQLDLEIEQENAGLSDEVVEIAHLLQDLFETPHDSGFYDMVRRWGGEGAKRTGPSELLNFHQRNAVLEQYADSNNRIKELFFADEKPSNHLFYPPKQQGDKRRKDADVDPHTELMMRLIYGAYKEFGALHKLEKVVDKLKRKVPGLD